MDVSRARAAVIPLLVAGALIALPAASLGRFDPSAEREPEPSRLDNGVAAHELSALVPTTVAVPTPKLLDAVDIIAALVRGGDDVPVSAAVDRAASCATGGSIPAVRFAPKQSPPHLCS